MLRAAPGVREMRPAFSKVITIWWTDGAVTSKWRRNVEMAKACDGLRHGIHDGFGIGAVRFNCDHWLAMRLRRTGGFGRLFRRVGVGQSDQRTVRGKPSRYRRANTPRASQDKCDLID